jgi:DIRP
VSYWFRYNHNSFVEAAASIGIHPSARLTASEWKAVRRQIRTKPRRFSKRFIEAQLGERNEFRHAVRMRQRSPLVDGMNSLSYDVPALIQTGATATAYCRRFRILQRGTVLGYDATKATYRIKFDDAKFGIDVECPDSEVASHGGARILIEARTKIMTPSVYGSTSLLPTGSNKASLHGTFPQFRHYFIMPTE